MHTARERHHRLTELFREARSLPAGERDAFLDERCGDDEALRNDLLELLAQDGRSAPMLESPLIEVSAVLSADRPSTGVPESVGRYRIIRTLGAGGMGVVYEARQESPNRTVALKILNAGVTTPGALRRFEHEAELLGRLQHPGIAQIFEAGSFDAGADARQFFAMELIQGELLTDFAAQRGLDVRQRLELVARVCDAVHHAHQRGVIHRDLKPGNILVDESGQPKILDFGVARATDRDLQTATLRTEVGQLIGTLPYMSPEQAAGDPGELDTRSDVYALGVLAYRLLAERLPYEVADRMIHDAVRVIREVEPDRLSSIDRRYRGDVETIVAKALEKDKTRRYQSAAEMAADIRRYLHDEPIVAQPATTLYQLRKFARRHKGLVGAMAAVFVALLAGVVAMSWGLAKAVAANEREVVQREIAEAVNVFLNDDLLAASDPYNTRDRDVTMRSVLDTAGERVEGRFDGQPRVEAAVRATLGRTYRNLGEYDSAERHLAAALALTRAAPDTAPRDAAALIDDLALVHYWAGELDRAEAMLLEALPAARAALGPDDPLLLRMEGSLAMVYADQSRFDDAEPLSVATYEASLRGHGPDHELTMTAMARLAMVYERQGRLDEALAVGAEVLSRRRRLLGDDHPDTIGALNNMGSMHISAAQWSEAEPYLTEALALMTRVMGPEHAHTMVCTRNLAQVHRNLGRIDDAERLLRIAYETDLRNLGEEHAGTLNSMNDLAHIYRSQDRLDEAEELMRKVLEVSRRVQGDEHAHTIVYTSTLASVLYKQEQYDEAATLYEAAVAAKRRAFPDGHWHIGAFLTGLGRCRTRTGDYAGAETAFEEASRILHEAFGPDNARTITLIESQIDLYDAWNKPSRAAELRALVPAGD